MPTGAQLLLEALKAHGVDTIFGIPGSHNLAIYDAHTPATIGIVGDGSGSCSPADSSRNRLSGSASAPALPGATKTKPRGSH